MVRRLLLVGLMCFMASFVHAASVPGLFYNVAISSITTTIVTVSTTAAVQMDNPQLAGRVSIEIDNIDSTANLWCLPGSTTTAAASNSGRKITPGNSWTVAIADGILGPGSLPVRTPVLFWCRSDGTSATKAAISQAY